MSQRLCVLGALMFARLSAEPRQHAAAIPLRVDHSDAEVDQQSQRSAAGSESKCSVVVLPVSDCRHLHRQFWEIMKGADDKIQRSLTQQRSARWQAVAAEIAENNMEKAQMQSVSVFPPKKSTKAYILTYICRPWKRWR